MTAVELVKTVMLKTAPYIDGQLDLATIRKTIIHMVGAHPDLTEDGVINQAISDWPQKVA
jgi:hypothetical protein